MVGIWIFTIWVKTKVCMSFVTATAERDWEKTEEKIILIEIMGMGGGEKGSATYDKWEYTKLYNYHYLW